MKFPALLSVAIVVSFCIPAMTLRADDAAPATQPAKVSSDARLLIDQISSAYKDLHALNLAGKITVDLQVEGSSPETHAAEFTSAYIAPNKFRHQVKGDVLIGNTGQKLYTFQAEDNSYTQADAPKERVASKDMPKALAGLLSIQDPSLVLAISKSPSDELLDGVADATKVDDTKVDDVSCPTLKFAQKDKSIVTISVDPQTHLMRQAMFDLTPQLKSRRADLAKAIVTVTYTKISTDNESKDELFAWAPPPGAKDADATAVAQRLDAPEASQLEGKAAPHFKLEGLDGKPVSLADLKGKVVVIDFWATWCGPCRASLPHLNKLYTDEKANGLQVFALNEQEDKGDVQKFVDQTKLTVPVLLDSEGKVGNQYGVTGIPQTVVIGKDGKIKKVMVGFGGEESAQELKKAVDAAMKE